ncbi:MAG TPA: tRNA pseudouridine(55) synthase TruB, partial [Candidatus Eisenbacteria bacterium]
MADLLHLVDKAEGWTSHDAVARLRTILGESRVGHAGTLDPFASGL